jgi:hypothetical protein
MKVHATKIYKEMETQLHEYLTLAPDGGEWFHKGFKIFC